MDAKAIAAENKKRFQDAWPPIAKELVDFVKLHNMPDNAVEWFSKSLDYNAPGGKLNRGISVVDTVELLLGRNLQGEEYQRAAILGWCVELLQAFFLVSDDIMDSSITRRGQPCWYRVKDLNIKPISNVGMIAINDAFMLESSIYHLLKTHFRRENYYVDLVDLFHDVTFLTEIGQLIDLITAPEDLVDLSQFSLERHRLIVIYKTAYYSFYLPVALAMYMVGISSSALHDQAKSILIPLGEYFQIQDDYLDCFGTPEEIGKIGTDILDNKCSWCINTALKKCNADQRKILDDNYGRKDSAAEARVKKVFHEVDLTTVYNQYEQESYERITKLIDQVDESPIDGSPVGMKKAVYTSFLNKIYKRTKRMQDASKLSSPSSSPPPSPFFPAVSTALEDRHSISMRPGKINILPRTTGRYSPLDNAGTTGSRKFGWKGVALVLGIFVGAVWFINPQQQLQQYTSPHVEDVGMPYEDLDFSNTVPTNQPHPPFVPTKGDSKAGAIADEEDEDAAAASDHPPTLAQSPKSPEDDPDPLKTVHCLAPYKPNLPLVQYALMIDAGSTGSRIHIYKFHNCHASPTLEYEVFKMTIPGLSSYASDPDAAAKSLDVLMQEAVKVVPEKVQGCTKVAVKATAGLRLLGKDVSDAILAAVKQRITSEYKFPLAGKDAVTIMDGKDEGVYAWITANYLLGAIGGGAKGTRPTYAVLDLGGASTQIVFEPTFSQTGDGGSTTTTTALEEGDHKYILSFTGKKHTLYQHSYLGYGLMRARRSVHNLVAFMWDFRLDGKGGHDAPESADPVVPNPCLAKGTTRRISLD
ncbi:Farnesyl pyrophosphate synthetase, partial [Tulasnella sp. 403]